ncbi:MAG: hypothetical protein MK291_12490, partial [Planctomycetes bacterium]|nr:hypothetical protein [Planctomycetota bacterium]
MGWAFFAFEPISDSRWKRYHFELKSPDHCRLIGTNDASLQPIPVFKSFHGTELMSSPLRGMTRGSLRQPDRDLVFRAWCNDSPSAVLSRLDERTGGVLWLAALLWIAGTAICLRLFVFADHDADAEIEEERAATEATPAPVTAAAD